jgi:AAT family amino acid transporter/GABA permease
MAESRTNARASRDTQESATPRSRLALRQRQLSSVVGYVAIIAAIVSPRGVFLFLVNASGGVMLFVCRSLQRDGEQPELPMWRFPWLSYAVVAAIVGLLVSMGVDAELRPQLMASIASLAFASAAWLPAAKRRNADDGTRTGILAAADVRALSGER